MNGATTRRRRVVRTLMPRAQSTANRSEIVADIGTILRQRRIWTINEGSSARQDRWHGVSRDATRPLHPRRPGNARMFEFLTSYGKDAVDPLVSAKTVSSWLRQLPALDVIGRQQHVMRAFEAMRQSRKPIDLSRVAAVEFLDAALGADRRQLIKQYVENVDDRPQALRAHLAGVYDLSQGFMLRVPGGARRGAVAAEQSALEAAGAALVHAPHALRGHRRQASRVPLRALDPGQVDRPAPHVPARDRTRCRPHPDACSAAPGRTRRHGRSSRSTCSCCSCTSSTPAT